MSSHLYGAPCLSTFRIWILPSSLSKRESTAHWALDPRWRLGSKVSKGEIQRGRTETILPTWYMGPAETPADEAEDCSGSQLHADNTVPLEDQTAPVLPWEAVSNTPVTQTQRAATSSGSVGPEPTLRDILSVITSCNHSINTLEAEMSFLHQDIQKLSDHTAAIEGRISTIEDDWAPCRGSHTLSSCW